MQNQSRSNKIADLIIMAPDPTSPPQQLYMEMALQAYA
jgi:hypothetical protein